MSLNGLDDPKVKEAHEAAAAEPGGWFLLKYAARDEVDLLGRGNGGIVEIRNNISQYEETSPLFGFLRYRRRNVLIKYLPDDCSRLVQARLSVHFNAVCERFAPYNTTFSISTAKELKDTKLSAACSLHAASGSTSSSTSSLRRRRLMEIAEEEEEEQRAVKRSSTVLEDDDGDSDTDRPRSPDSPPPVLLNSDLAAQPEESKFSPSVDPPNFVGVDRPESPSAYDDEGRRLSSQTARPDLYSYNSYPYGKPKVKLGPRPSLEASGRPKTAAGAGNFRPVSQMPTGLKMFSKGSKRVKAADDNDNADHDPTAVAFPIVNNNTIDHPSTLIADDGSSKSPTSPVRPATSSGVSMKSPVVTTFPAVIKNTMTPEKARLMRAMQLREKKKQASLLPPAAPAAEGSNQDEHAEHRQQSPEAEDSTTGLATLQEEEEKRQSMAKLDSGVVVDSATESHAEHEHSDAAQSDSRPESPLAPSSEPDQSTKASSLSEATDETVKSPGVDDSERESSPAGEDKFEAAEQLLQTTEQDQEGEEREHSTLVDSSGAEDGAEVSEVLSSPPKSEQVADEPVAANNTDEAAEAAVSTQVVDTADSEPQPEETEEPSTAAVQETHNKAEAAEEAAADDIPEPPLTPPVSKFARGRAMSPSSMTPESKETASDAVATPPHGIPTSKFSTSSPVGVPTIVPPPAEAEESDLATSEENAQKQKRRTIEPIRTDLKIGEKASNDNLSDDDALMDELQSATLEHAKPMLVSKSPVSPMFPSPSPTQETGDKGPPRVVRTSSNPIRGNLLTPSDVTQNSARSVSSGAAYLHKITQQHTSSRENLLPKTGKLGSRISQRIKALEMLSVTTPGDVPTRSNSTRSVAPSATFFSVGKGREPSRSPSVADRATSLSRRSPQRSSTAISDSREGSPEFRVQRERSLSVASRLSMFEAPTVPSPTLMPRGRQETISVTARILRDPSEVGLQPEVPKDPSEFSRLELRQSPLEVNHQRADAEHPSPPKQTIQERRMSRETRKSQSDDKDEEEDPKARRSSLSIVRDFIKDRRKSLSSAPPDVLTAPSVMSPKTSPSRPPSTHNNSSSSFPRRLSISSRRSSISKDAALSPSATEASGSGDDSRSTKSDKKKGRAGRFMRRLSSSISSSLGKNMTPTAISPTVKEEDATDMGDARPAQPSVQYMGDVNVQFPDNLLWKRRTLGLDSQGFLILSASNATGKDKPTIGVKRYHLSDFRTPFTPDVEVQELPNSVVLDFIEGSGLQMACEDRAGQMELLNTLLEAHQSHTQFGQ